MPGNTGGSVDNASTGTTPQSVSQGHSRRHGELTCCTPPLHTSPPVQPCCRSTLRPPKGFFPHPGQRPMTRALGDSSQAPEALPVLLVDVMPRTFLCAVIPQTPRWTRCACEYHSATAVLRLERLRIPSGAMVAGGNSSEDRHTPLSAADPARHFAATAP